MFDVRSQRQRVGILLLILLMLVVASYRWTQFGGNAAPPGSDGGQWLAFGHELFGGDSVRAGFQFYPPFLPFAVKLVSLVISPLGALKLVGILTSVIIAIPVYLLLRTTLTPWLSAVIAITATLTPFNNEVLCFGGYPQLLGTSFLLFSTFSLLKGFNTGQKRWFLAAAVAAAATVGSNILPALVLVMTSCVILLILFYKLWHGSKKTLYYRFRNAFLYWLVPSVILSLPFSNIYFAYLSTAESSPANPAQLTIADIAGWAGSAWLWELILWAGILSVIAFSLPFWGKTVLNKPVLLVDAAVAILMSTFVGFLLTRELRFLAFVEIGLILMTGLIPDILGSILSRQKARRFLVMLTLLFMSGLVLAVGTVGHHRFLIAYDWYEVVDTPVLAALDWLRYNEDPEAIVVTTGTERGHNYGWWIEGYAHHPAYMAGDPFLFFNTEERAQVALAQSLLLLETPPQEIRVLAERNNIRFLFLDKRVFQRTLGDLVEAGFIKCFENDVIVIMRR